MRIVCLVRPHISTVKHLNRMLKTMSSCRTRAVVVLGWIPRLSPALSQQLLSDRLIQVVDERVPLHWSPLFDDVLVMPATPRSFVDIHAKGSVYAVEQFYWGLEFLEADVFGAYVPSIYALGSAGSSLCKVAMNVRRHYETLASISVADDSGVGDLEHRPLAPVHRTLKGTPWDVMPDAGLEEEDTGRIGFWGSRPCSFVGGCYLVDRKCDLVGLLSSPFTYGALLDFHLGLRSNCERALLSLQILSSCLALF
ncbi:MAG: hypothetical protein KVP17_003344 [Porospora cf. gigantea B]|uniref:uncharacterized protein n=1 Tax=Porospora cf. gigantea B TaxID=2853592 RepID=UPI00357197AE|nr:MAG: hypothetical protein KVP17_003344 [Porospora cf. gigantea B]